MADKITCIMVLKVDLECLKCHKKIKKVLAKFPQIRDQSYDVKQNTVTITVVCCSPEKFRDKLCCKGGKIIKSIEIKLPPKPPKPKPKQDEPKPKPQPPEPKPKQDKPNDQPKDGPETAKAKPVEKAPEPVPVQLVPGFPPGYLFGACCGSCYAGHRGGPCHQWYGRPVPCYVNYCYGPYSGYRGGYCRGDYFCEENTSGCTIM